jgi:hypothetical protein
MSRHVRLHKSCFAMRFQFEPHTTGGLHVIAEIPNVSPCLIEGRNGIGKTVAVRLLELIAGHQPFSDRQWHSLRKRLGNTVVRAEDLRDGQTFEFTFTPEEWSSDEGPPLAFGEWLGRVTIDGAGATVEEAQELLWVERFAGNEDLDLTLRRRTQSYADNAQRTSRAVTGAVERVTTLLGPLRDELSPVDPSELAETKGQLEKAEAAEKAARDDLAERIHQHEQVLGAIEARDRLRAAEDPHDGLQQRRRELAKRLADLSQDRDNLAERIDKTSGSLKRQGDPQAALGEAQRILRYRLKRQRNIRSDIERLSGVLDVNADLELIAEEEAKAKKALLELEERQRAVNAGGMTVQIIDTVAGVLAGPGAEGLDEQVFLRLPERVVTVAEARGGMMRQRDQLHREPKPDDLESLTRDASRVQRRVTMLADLAARIQDTVKQQARIDEAETDVTRAEAAVERAGKRDEDYRTDNQQLGALEEEIDTVTGELTDVHGQLGLEGGKSPDDARSDLESMLTALELEDPSELDAFERGLRRRLDDGRVDVQRAADHAAALRRSVMVMNASVDAAMSVIGSDERFAWLHDVLTNEASPGDAFARLRGAVMGILDELEESRNLVEVVGTLAGGALQTQPMVPDVQLNRAVRAVLAEELRQGLDTPQIRKWLFGGAQVEAIDLEERELVLVKDGASSAPRAFDTFSTGEQAFAFTQARILELEPSNRPNRLLVLDEFGAFVAADRMPDLAAFLRGVDVAPIADQVLVILPLQLDYEAELGNTTGRLRQRFETRANALRDRDYYAEQLEA